MNLSNCIAAKARNGKQLPLAQHLSDTEDIIYKLKTDFISPSIINATGLDDNAFQNLALFLACVHDIGKSTIAFQNKICQNATQLINKENELGFDVSYNAQPNDIAKLSYHALAGASILNCKFGIDESICEIVAAHHGKPRDEGKETSFRVQMNKYSCNYYSEYSMKKYETVQAEIVNSAKTKADISGISNLTVRAQMILSGIIIMADWIASNEEFFPLFDDYYSIPDWNRLGIGLKKLDLQQYTKFNTIAINSKLFETRFGFQPNDMQNQIMEIANNIISPGIMIIEAPMGLGKTEAALAAAEVESAASGSGGIYFGLPTRGTANGMFPRVEKWASIVSNGTKTSISLSHGSAQFNSLYTELKSKTNDEDEDGLSVNAQMSGRYRTMLPDFVTGTVDQALFAALKRKFIMLLHLGLAGKTIIIDEIHSYDDYTSQYMYSILSWLGAYKIPVILLSATLTKEKRSRFVEAYTGKKVTEDSDAYPSIIQSDGEQTKIKHIDCKDINKMDVAVKYTSEENAAELIKKYLSDGGCAGIILDTVGGAQDMYESLKLKLPSDFTVLLLHSRFLPKDRSKIEDNVISLVGKSSKDRNKIVIVGTQVLEQSLDLDFDILFTEKCPIDLLLQRIGRLHRHKRNNRPFKIKDAVCYIFNDENACKKASYPYDSYILRRTDECLNSINYLTIPDDIRGLTESVYNLSIGSDGKDKQQYLKKKIELTINAKAYLLPDASKCEFKGMLCNTVSGQGSVRYGINQIDVILLKKTDLGVSTLSGECEIKDGNVPDQKATYEILQNKISLRYDEDIEQEIELTESAESYTKEFEKQKQNPFFEKELFLLTNKNGIAILGKHTYEYTNEFGQRKKE